MRTQAIILGVTLAGALAWMFMAQGSACPSRTEQDNHSAVITLLEQWGNLEGEWRFRTDPADHGEAEGWQRAEYADAEWRLLRAPGYWEAQGITEPRPGQPPKPKAGLPHTDYDGVAWYRLRFRVPEAWKGQELLLLLGSVDDEDRVYFNGSKVGQTGPVVPQSVSVQRQYRVPASLVKAGTENLLAVRVTDNGGPGGIMGPFLTLLPRKIAAAPIRVPGTNRSLKAQFENPAGSHRILKIIHGWPDGANEQEMLIRQLIAQGFGGVVCNVSFNDYLTSEARWQDFTRAVKQAKAAGMTLWLYDERGYPSGVAGGLTLKDHPELEARGLLIQDTTNDGGKFSLDLPPGKPVSVAAYPFADGKIDPKAGRDLKNSVSEGKLTAELPAGRWRVIAMTEDRLYAGTHAELSLADKKPYINLLEPEPPARFLKVNHDPYAARLGSDLSPYFEALFTDEPSLMSMFLRPMPYRVLPWGHNMSAEFRERRGYALEPHLPALIAETGKEGKKARYDFWKTVGELVSENYFGQIQQWGRKHKIPSGGHLLMEESLLTHVPLYGDFFQCMRRLDAPSIDCLTSPPQVPWSIARMAGSAADLDGRELVMCETSDFGQVYRGGDDKRPVQTVTEEEIRGTCNRLMVGGINVITSYYTWNGLSSEQIRRLNEWVGRCSLLLRGGHQVADVALLYPIESIWPRFIPARHLASDSPSAVPIENAFQTASDSLYAARRDFTYVDSRTLIEAKVKDGGLTHGKLRWRVVILPHADTLPLAAWENLQRFVQSGGVVVALGARPANSEREFPSSRVQAIASELFGEEEAPHVKANAKGGAGIYLPPGAESLLPIAINAVLETDVKITDRATPVRVTHRRVKGQEIYFLINDSGQPWKGNVTLAVNGAGEVWNPADGKITPVQNGTNVALDLPAYGGTLVRFASAAPPKRHPVKSGLLPGLKLTSLPDTEPQKGAGEFVQATVTPENGDWKAVGTLTKSQTDTFLFLTFRYGTPLDLSRSDGLSVETTVPQGQTTSTNLLVMVIEKDGAIYMANTNRPLAQSGPVSTLIPWSRFQLAGWSKDANGQLDLDRIAAINLGWGGYFGTEGERVEFTVSPLKAFTLP